MREKQIAELEAIADDLATVRSRAAQLISWINPGFAMGKVNSVIDLLCDAQDEIDLAIKERKNGHAKAKASA